MPTLTSAKREHFVNLYVSTGNATKAYQISYNVKSESVAASCASRLLNNAKVISRIDEIRKPVVKSTQLDHAKRLEIAARIALDETTPKHVQLKAIMTHAELAGDLIHKTDVTSDGQVLPSIVPVINFTIPQVLLQRRGEVHTPN